METRDIILFYSQPSDQWVICNYDKGDGFAAQDKTSEGAYEKALKMAQHYNPDIVGLTVKSKALFDGNNYVKV